MIKKAEPSRQSEDVVRFVALGGLEEIGRNMMFFEYKNEILIIDVGLQFPEEETPGIDYIIPNIQYLRERVKNIRGIIITHGHYDHIGALPYLLDKLGNPPIYATQLTREIVMKRQEDFPNSPKPNFVVIKPGDTHTFGKFFKATFFPVVHNIPDGIGTILETPVGKILHPGEFKFDYDHEGKPKGLDVWEKVGKEKIHTLLLDSTGSEVPGYSLSERIVEAELQKGTIIPLEEINKHKDDKVLILSTGAQGEPNASLMRIANGEHKHIKIKQNDTIILSSSIVPGNERSVQNLKDNLARQGALVYHYKMLDIHSSGHAPQEELKTVMRLVKPQYFIPIHGYYFMRWRNAKLAQEAAGLKPENTILADNGCVVEIRKDSVQLTKEEVPSYYVMVDGLGVGDVGEVVLRDRRVLAEEGMVVVIVTL